MNSYFGNYDSLASVAGDTDLMQPLVGISSAQDQDAKGKYSYLLRYLRQHKPSE